MFIITAPDTKGQKEAEKGLKGNLDTNNPLGPFWPLQALFIKLMRSIPHFSVFTFHFSL